MARWFWAAMAAVALAGAAGCATDKRSSAKEWARAECGRIVDEQARQRCLRRADEE